MVKIKAIEIKNYIGKEFRTKWYQVTQEAIDKFADITKDHQFIHISPEKAKRSMYGETVMKTMNNPEYKNMLEEQVFIMQKRLNLVAPDKELC